MKKISISMMVVLIACSVNAQSLHVGGKAGANLTQISGVSFSDGYQRVIS